MNINVVVFTCHLSFNKSPLYQPTIPKVRCYSRINRQTVHTISEIEQLRNVVARLKGERDAAERLFSRMSLQGMKPHDNVRYFSSPQAYCSGDVILMHVDSNQCRQQIMLADMSGHGLPAAVGAIPGIEVFKAMTRKGISMQDIVVEINKKMHAQLPVGMFMAAVFMEYDISKSRVQLMNFGMPDVIKSSCIAANKISTFASTHAPLGISAHIEGHNTVISMDLLEDDIVIACSDGLLDARNLAGEMYGMENLLSSIENFSPHKDPFDSITDGINLFRSGTVKGDDMTYVQLSACKRED